MVHGRVQGRTKRWVRRTAVRDAKITKALRCHWNYRNYDPGNSTRIKMYPKIIRNLSTRPQKRGCEACPLRVPATPKCLWPAMCIYRFLYVTPYIRTDQGQLLSPACSLVLSAFSRCTYYRGETADNSPFIGREMCASGMMDKVVNANKTNHDTAHLCTGCSKRREMSERYVQFGPTL